MPHEDFDRPLEREEIEQAFKELLAEGMIYIKVIPGTGRPETRQNRFGEPELVYVSADGATDEDRVYTRLHLERGGPTLVLDLLGMQEPESC